MKKALLIYRGPLQRSRLRLIILAYIEVFDLVDFVWLLPNEKYHNSTHKPFDEFIAKFELNEIQIISGKLKNIFLCRRLLLEYTQNKNISNFAIIGTSAQFFVHESLINKATWFINGIPEEKLLHSNSFKNRIRINIFWKSLQFRKVPKRIVTVSSNMGEYLSRFFPKSDFYTVPSTVPIYSSSVNSQSKKFLVYSGSGAPWQWIEKLEEIWYQLYILDSNLKFKVISRDKRVNKLKTRIPDTNISFVSAHDSFEVFEHLKNCRIGFLIRQDHLINRVASPIKFGEYLGAGCLVVTSDLKWAISDFVNENECGLLVNPDIAEPVVAKQILNYLHTVSSADNNKAKMSALAFSLSSNIDRLAQIISKGSLN